MCKRGWILLLATLPIWIYVLFVWRQYEQSKSIGKNGYVEGMRVPLPLGGGAWAFTFLTPVALGSVLFDSFSWLRQRHA